jgi:hypothetical protein
MLRKNRVSARSASTSVSVGTTTARTRSGAPLAWAATYSARALPERPDSVPRSWSSPARVAAERTSARSERDVEDAI